MVALFLCGLLLAFACSLLLAAAFFVQAWRQHRGDVEYLLFGLSTLAVSGYTACCGLAYWGLGDGATGLSIRTIVDLCVVSGAVAIPLLLHFGLRYAKVENERRVMNVVYPLAVLHLVTISGGWYWSSVPESFLVMSLFGVDVPVIAVTVTPIGGFFLATTFASAIAVVPLTYAAYRRSSGEGGSALFGALVFVLTVFNDALGIGAGLYDSISLVPFGFLVFVYGMTVTLVDRYGRLSEALSRRKQQLAQRSDELARAMAELQQTQEELLHTEQLAVVGEFAAVITHEVRNPVAIVNEAVTTLRDTGIDTVNDDTRGVLGIIEEAMSRLERLVTLLLNYARPVVPQRAKRDVKQLLLDGLEPVERLAEVKLDIECHGEWPELYLDAELIRQAFDNVIANAVQAMDARGELTVRVARRTIDGIECVVIGFEDTGEGMTEHQMEQARAPFYTTRPSGAGLGLAICDRIIEAHGGGMVISSELGVGTAVSVILPESRDERLDTRPEHRAPTTYDIVIN
jgi:signal transduction histidine kinase